MKGRRSFLALVGGAIVSGLVTWRQSVAKPTLIIPPTLMTDPPAIPTGAYPFEHELMAAIFRDVVGEAQP